MLPDPAGRIGACLGNRSVFVLDPRLEVAVNLPHFSPPPPPPPQKSAAFSKSNYSSFGPSIEIMKRLFKILLLSLFRSHFWTTFWRTWKFSLVFHSGIPCNIPWSVLNLWLTVLVQRNEQTISRQVSWMGKWGKTLSIARKSNEKTLGNVSIFIECFFFLYLWTGSQLQMFNYIRFLQFSEF